MELVLNSHEYFKEINSRWLFTAEYRTTSIHDLKVNDQFHKNLRSLDSGTFVNYHQPMPQAPLTPSCCLWPHRTVAADQPQRIHSRLIMGCWIQEWAIKDISNFVKCLAFVNSHQKASSQWYHKSTSQEFAMGNQKWIFLSCQMHLEIYYEKKSVVWSRPQHHDGHKLFSNKIPIHCQISAHQCIVPCSLADKQSHIIP